MIVAEVKLWKTLIGVVSIDEGSPYCNFVYDKNFLRSGIQVSPLHMPLTEEIFSFRLPLDAFQGLPGLLSDSLPDKYGTKIINTWLDAQGRSRDSFTVIERLCYIGTRGMGALEFYPSQYEEYNELEEIEINKLVDLSNQIINEKEKVISNHNNELEDIIKVGTSAGGARAKAIIAYNENTGIIKSGQLDAGKGFNYWLLKLDGVKQADEETSFTRREYAYYLMATDAGINMSESRLLKKDGYYHFMTKRFDRIMKPDGSMDKVHMQTLAALDHIDYNEPGLMSYERVTQIMYDLGIKLSENEQFFRRMVFNVMARNQDDHVKNISFLMNRSGKWSLSPAYDITYAYNPKGNWTALHQMTINGKRKDITLVDLLSSAKAMKIPEENALTIIKEVQASLHKWSTFCKKAELNDKEMQFIEKQFNTYNL